MIVLPFEDLMEFAYSSIRDSKDVPIDEALIFAVFAVAYSNMAIAQELKRFNDRVDLDRENESHLIG